MPTLYECFSIPMIIFVVGIIVVAAGIKFMGKPSENYGSARSHGHRKICPKCGALPAASETNCPECGRNMEDVDSP